MTLLPPSSSFSSSSSSSSPSASSWADDLFALGQRAAAARDALLGPRATFVRGRQLLSTGAWRGPRDAAESYVEEADLPALGGWAAARDAGATVLVGGRDAEVHRTAVEDGARSLWRIPFRAGESDVERSERLRGVAALVTGGLSLWGVLPTPEGEPYGLDTLRFVALCRLGLPGVPHLLADGATLGPRLAQMCLGFGADELHAPIVAERALRLGANAGNPALTRKEAITLIRGAGLRAAERLAGGALEEAV
jgi:hypothetical protein